MSKNKKPLRSKQNYDDLVWNKNSFPKKIEEDEDIILIIREDIVLIIYKGLSLYLGFFALLIIRVFLSNFDSVWIFLYNSLMYGIATFLLVIFTIMFHNYYLSLQIITNKRIIDIDQKGLFRREVNSISLESIQNTTHNKNSFLKTIFNYGDVVVETSGEQTKESATGTSGVVFNNVPNPSEVANILDKIKESANDKEIEKTAKLQAEYLAQSLSKRMLGN
jgi:uncharacterized membrane protein YdbT with pleckstrin-like domain